MFKTYQSETKLSRLSQDENKEEMKIRKKTCHFAMAMLQ